jgi:hypothetical protein
VLGHELRSGSGVEDLRRQPFDRGTLAPQRLEVGEVVDREAARRGVGVIRTSRSG